MSIDAIERIRELEKSIAASRENINGIADLLKFIEKGTDESKFHSLKALLRIFSRMVDSDEIVHTASTVAAKKAKGSGDAVANVSLWLRKKYFSYINSLLVLLHNDEPGLQTPALEALMSLVLKIAESHSRKEKVGQSFQNILFPSIVAHLVLNKNLNDVLLEAFREKYLWKFDDVRFYALVNIRTLLEARRSGKQLSAEFSPSLELLGSSSSSLEDISTDVFASNIFQIIRELHMPTKPSELDGFFAGVPEKTSAKKSKISKKESRSAEFTKASRKLVDLAEHKKVFTKCWLEFLKISLPATIYKQVLTGIHELVIPHLTTPVLIMDFLSASYDIGGVVSLLALNGLFIMMHKHNLEYPDFYRKLYAMFQPELFYVKYRSRFFKLSQIFLSSSHLPTYLVCAFAKRIARLALLAPPPVTMTLVPLLYNIFVTHPAAHVLLHRVPKRDLDNQILMLNLVPEEVVKQDPFSFLESDPVKCGASDSSLWEIQGLLNHYVPAVATMAKIFEFNGEFKRMQYKLDDEIVDQSYQSMLEFELKRRNKHGFPLAFAKPPRFFGAEFSNFDAWIVESEIVHEQDNAQKGMKRKRKE